MGGVRSAEREEREEVGGGNADEETRTRTEEIRRR